MPVCCSDMIGSVRLMRYDANGDTLWVREFGGPGETWVGSQVKHTSDDGFLICGYTDAFSMSDAFALKVGPRPSATVRSA